MPVLFVNDERVWDSLAISEAVAELFPAKKLWSEDRQARALARSVYAGMRAWEVTTDTASLLMADVHDFVVSRQSSVVASA